MRILIGCLLLLSASVIHAKCASRSLSYWPPVGETIATEPIVLTEGFGMDQQTIKNLKGARLIAPGHTVSLKRLAQHTGAMRLTQIAWTPQTPLTPGKTYVLELQGKTKAWRPTRYTADWEKKVRVKWTVAKASLPAAAWNGSPRLGESNYRRLGCGPAVGQAIVMPVMGALALVEVVIERDGAPQSYLLPVSEKGEVRIGHGMCSGAFDVKGEGTFAARFALLRADGTRDAAPARLSFPAVTPQRKGP